MEDTFKARGLVVALKVSLDLNSSGLPTDPCSNNSVRQLCQLVLVQPMSSMRSHARVPTQPSPERCAHHPSPDSSSRPAVGSFKLSPRCDQSVFTLLLGAPCLLVFLFSRHGPLIVPSAQLFNLSKGFTQCRTRLTNSDNCLFLSVLHIRRWLDSTDVSSSCCGVWCLWSIEYPSCNVAVLMLC